MMPAKRPGSDLPDSSQLVKRPRAEVTNDSVAVSSSSTTGRNGELTTTTVPRTSGLKALTMELSGHSDAIYALKFDPTGRVIASGSADRKIFLWQTYGDCKNYGMLTGHKGAIFDLQWSHDAAFIWSASADMTIASWDVESGQRIRRHLGHEHLVNCVDVSRRGQELLLSGSDDKYIGIWDPRQKEAVDFLETDYPVTGVAFTEGGNEIFSGGLDHNIHAWDLRKSAIKYSMPGHTDMITSLQVSPDSQTLLSKSLDSTARTWDIRPFAPTDRNIKIYDGAVTGLEKNLLRASWNPTGEKIIAGGGDGTVVVWEVNSGKMLYKLPGHKGTVNDVRFSPGPEPIVASSSTDRNILLGELGK